MCDIKTDLINQIMLGMAYLPPADREKLLNELVVDLRPYNVELAQYEIATVENSATNLFEKYMAYKSIKGLSHKSLEIYKLRIEEFLQWNTKLLDDVTSDDIITYLYNFKRVRNVSNTTLGNIRSALSSFFTWLYSQEYISKNPMNKVDLIKSDTHKEKPFSADELERLRNGCANDLRMRALIEFMLATGCRVSEICSINIGDVDFNKKEFTVIGKGNKKRTCYFNELSLFHLAAYLQTRQFNLCDPLFAKERKSADGDMRLQPMAIQTALRRLANEVGVSGVHPHRFRRTCCCTMVNRGMPIESAKEILGHTNINMTMRYFNSDSEKVKGDYMRLGNM